MKDLALIGSSLLWMSGFTFGTSMDKDIILNPYVIIAGSVLMILGVIFVLGKNKEE